MGNRALVQKLGYRTNQNAQESELKLEQRTGHPNNLQKDFTPFFKENEIVRVKVSSLGEEGYAFWRSFEDMAALSRIPLMPVNSNLKSNVQGALGYWLGYGSSFYEVRIKVTSGR